ncbi:MAG TPA: response regulator [Opitutus sp.]|nr:response regulator [Opitutus sp.]
MTKATSGAKILVVDDDEGLLILMAETLRGEGYTVSTANSGAAALETLARETPDLMLLDLKLSDVGGPELLKRLRKDHLKVAFIVVTGQGDEKVAVEVMKEGALDYVMKDTALLDLLPAVVKRALTAIERDRALAEAERTRQRLQQEILEVSEREQHRIGQDLHDGLGQQLTAIEMMCASLKADIAERQPDLKQQVERIGGLLREAIAQTRSMARGLVPVKDAPEALWASLFDLAERTTAVGRLTCRVDAPDPVMVNDAVTAGHLYRIAQEAVNNALKHSDAKEIVIRLGRRRGALELSIADNGRGLADGENRGLGLQVMQHRAAMIGGELAVESKAGKGVTVRCVVKDGAREIRQANPAATR